MRRPPAFLPSTPPGGLARWLPLVAGRGGSPWWPGEVAHPGGRARWLSRWPDEVDFPVAGPGGSPWWPSEVVHPGGRARWLTLVVGRGGSPWWPGEVAHPGGRARRTCRRVCFWRDSSFRHTFPQIVISSRI